MKEKISQMKKLIQLERATGYQNLSAFEGFDNFFLNLAKEVEVQFSSELMKNESLQRRILEVTRIMEKYSSLSLPERRRKLEKVKAILESF